MSNPSQSIKKSQSDTSNVKEINTKNIGDKMRLSILDQPTNVAIKWSKEYSRIGVPNIDIWNTQHTKQIMAHSTLVGSITCEKTQPFLRSQIDNPRFRYSPVEEHFTSKTTENFDTSGLEEAELLQKKQEFCFKGASSHDISSKNNKYDLRCTNAILTNLLSCGSGFLRLCSGGAKYYMNDLAINGEERVKHNPLENVIL